MLDKPSRQHHPVISLIDEAIRLNSRLRNLFAGTTELTGLSAMQFTVLVAVVESRAPPTVPQIGRSLGHARQVIQRAANHLQGEGLIDTLPNPNHKRAPLLVATEAGRRLKHKADVRAIKVADQLLETVDAAACENLSSQLHGLRENIEAFIRKRDSAHGPEA